MASPLGMSRPREGQIINFQTTHISSLYQYEPLLSYFGKHSVYQMCQLSHKTAPITYVYRKIQDEKLSSN